jgi:hypothetical protein
MPTPLERSMIRQRVKAGLAPIKAKIARNEKWREVHQQTTYRRLKEQYDELQQRWLAGIMGRLG